MPDTTDRLALPLLSAGQAQKEMSHNEALAMLATLVQPVVVAVAPAAVPVSPALGQCWIVGIGATGAWAGKDGAIACWTSGGWRFAAPFDGMKAWSLGDSLPAFRRNGAWIVGTLLASKLEIGGNQVVGMRQPAIATPSGGSTQDTEARTALTSIVSALRNHGLIAT